jgi:hypothetical protein
MSVARERPMLRAVQATRSAIAQASLEIAQGRQATTHLAAQTLVLQLSRVKEPGQLVGPARLWVAAAVSGAGAAAAAANCQPADHLRERIAPVVQEL